MILLSLCYSQNKEKPCENTAPTLGTPLYPSPPLSIPQSPRYSSAPLYILSSPFHIPQHPLLTVLENDHRMWLMLYRYEPAFELL